MTWVMHEGVLLSRQGEAFICVSPGCLHENQGLCLGFVMSGTCVAMCHEFYTIEYVFFIPHGSVCRHRYTYHGGPSLPRPAASLYSQSLLKSRVASRVPESHLQGYRLRQCVFSSTPAAYFM